MNEERLKKRIGFVVSKIEKQIEKDRQTQKFLRQHNFDFEAKVLYNKISAIEDVLSGIADALNENVSDEQVEKMPVFIDF